MKISNDFINSVVNSISIKEPLVDILESIVDLETENEFIKNIPVIGWVFKTVCSFYILFGASDIFNTFRQPATPAEPAIATPISQTT